ncbi:MAG: glycine cleavage system aminomethyltransferase GcvT [Gammaproteobacteria bacterium]|nr:glycine cleavage system aminomethyltransferase GcvT [Gammaproteobacteria bacterium]
MSLRTPLYDAHVVAGAKLVDFAGWEMPIHYGSQMHEHQSVRSDAGVFDVSHMTVVDVRGSEAQDFLRYLLANDVAKLTANPIEAGKALYSCMLNQQGGVIDDLIVYYCAPDWYRVVVNAGTREKDLAWLQTQIAPFAAELTERTDLAMLAIQGPHAIRKTLPLLPTHLQDAAASVDRFQAVFDAEHFIARTGYTGEDGFEWILPAAQVEKVWQQLLQAQIAPIGLGARDTLRLEAGMCLYGNDLDETVSPLESGLAWTVALDASRDFIGRAALEKQRAAGLQRRLVGLVLETKGVLRAHQTVSAIINGVNVKGEITSGTFSPTLQQAIALARIVSTETLAPIEIGTIFEVNIRDKLYPARVVKYPFVRDGKSLI